MPPGQSGERGNGQRAWKACRRGRELLAPVTLAFVPCEHGKVKKNIPTHPR
ncbi:hypothetical protein STIAU_0972 [Stigmatella aurantiaca DW4/3-1]|uniref:Uncharacterized protein n=1 Tax=Stigmatella aurantiaca (strain DW4/3-1) TaxID=378806 RepID=Q08SF8_STIAD|nr:hypothetical protein STIAU_0972 [Stigmatella aurantiaca DW4/3-1]